MFENMKGRYSPRISFSAIENLLITRNKNKWNINSYSICKTTVSQSTVENLKRDKRLSS
jgi:hypothetical protein